MAIPQRNGRPSTLCAIGVEGYKSISKRRDIELGKLTVLAGANSSGKSSMMQPLLLLKQTMDAPYDPGALLLNGPNVTFTAIDQFLSKVGPKPRSEFFHVSFLYDDKADLTLNFKKASGKGIDLDAMEFTVSGKRHRVTKESTAEDLKTMAPIDTGFPKDFLPKAVQEGFGTGRWTLVRDRFLFSFELQMGEGATVGYAPQSAWHTRDVVKTLIHVPGLRGNPERTYKTSAVGSSFPGTFEDYVASVINSWQELDDARLATLGRHLERLGLTWKVRATRLDDTQVELRVGRLLRAQVGGQQDLVNIADVGFGMSQVLPVVVALLTADQGQIVYIEQPELHLHPRAQVAMADLLAEAARRGVRVVIETHSALLLLRIQTLAAQQYFEDRDVRLHWFTRNAVGETNVSSASLDRTGAFGKWPEDFGEVILGAQQQYLDAAEQSTLKF